MQKSVSIIIPTYNGVHLLQAFLPSVAQIVDKSHSVSDYEIIIVDDASTDTSIDYLKSISIPKMRWLQNAQNSGFSITMNRGIQEASMDLTLMLNNDMLLADDFFEKTIPYFSNENLFGVYSEIRDREGKVMIEGRKIPLIKHGKLHYQNSPNNEAGNSLYLCGGNALVDTNKLKMLGGFNELFSPFYFEDFDLSLRAWRKGWKCLYSNETYCNHCHSTTINAENKKEYIEKIFLRNQLLLNYLHSDSATWRKLSCKLFFKKLLYSVIRSNSHNKFLASLQAFHAIKEKAQQRREEEYLPLIPTKEIIRSIDW
ncbi:MAG: glycosyltransferase family 2 protein [Paludibacteraceae bacterium]|nr:glycosyltransferase family 2 protein [Paludibacteraceae bacterium]